MIFRKMVLCMMFIGLMGCAKRIPVTYDQVKQTNYVEITLLSGNKVEGTVVRSEPHQITIVPKGQRQMVISKTTIRSIKRKPPVMDDFGNGISEDEIESARTNKNTLIYGIGGGALSLGFSFFAGSLATQDSSGNGSILGATTLIGGGLGTYLFIRAGKAKDRQEAIDAIRDERRSIELKRIENEADTTDDMERLIEEEKQRQEELRKEREDILRELEE